jgi:hypothetical protein
MHWIKKGLLFEPKVNYGWTKTHSMLPIAQRINEDRFRIYFCSRDGKGRSQIGYFEINIFEPTNILYISPEPVINSGPLGAFDDSGATNSCIANHDNLLCMYYTGWSLGVTIPFYLNIGLAVSDDGGKTFHKASAAPIIDRNEIDPYLTAAPYILIEHSIWKMWYVSGVNWKLENGKPKHYYNIKYAESMNGIDWKRDGKVCIDFKSEEEYAISRPCVIKDNDTYKMWYSFRGKNYRIGYAESKDGLHWERKDEEAGINVSESGWDSEMIEYPFVFDHKGERYMLYNGNGYGRTGIGLAFLAK